MKEVTGSLQIKNNIYQAVLSYKENNKWKTKWISTGIKAVGKSKQQAKRELDRIIFEFNSGITPRKPISSSLGFIDYMKNWLEMIKTSVEKTTYLGYKKVIEGRMTEYWKPLNITIDQLKPYDIQLFYQYLSRLGLSGNTILHYHANIRKALQYAVKMELIPSNPADKIEKPKKEVFIAKHYSKEEVKQLFQAVKGSKLEVPVVLASYYGLRRSEVLGLRWSAIDFESKVISINHVILDLSEGKTIKIVKRDQPKTKASIRTLPLVPFIEEYLKTLKEKQERRKALLGKLYNKEYSDYVCVDNMGNIISPSYVSHQFTKLLRTHHLRSIRFHDLRHTCASIMLNGGADMKEIQLWLGHSNFNTTANIYAHLDTSRMIIGANIISNAYAVPVMA